jgi:hypothetical protein
MEKQLFEEAIRWQRQTIKSATPESCIKHLKKELDELLADIEAGRAGAAAHEFADCFLLLFGAADRYGMNWHQINFYIEEKMNINRMRTWGAVNADGFQEHVKEPNVS